MLITQLLLVVMVLVNGVWISYRKLSIKYQHISRSEAYLPIFYIGSKKIITENGLAYAVQDGYPASLEHGPIAVIRI